MINTDTHAFIQERVNTYFVSKENNCAMTVLKVLSEFYGILIDPQVIDAAQCVPGAGGVKHLCGLFTGVLMFIGVWGAQQGMSRQALRPISQGFSEAVLQDFGSLNCSDLRQDGGCGTLAVECLTLAVRYLDGYLNRATL